MAFLTQKKSDAGESAPGGRSALFRRLLAVAELPERLAIVAEAMRMLGPIDGYLFGFVNETGTALACQAVSLPGEFELVESAYRDFRFLLEEPEEAVRCFTESEVIRVDADNLAQCHVHTRTRFERWRMRSLVFIPIRAGDENVGMLLAFSQQDVIGPEAVAAIRELLEVTADAIQGAWRYSMLAESKSNYLRSGVEREQLIEFFSEANSLSVGDDLCPRLIERFLLYFPFDFVILFLVEGAQLVPWQWGTVKEDVRETAKRIFERSPPYDLSVAGGAPPIVVLRKMTMYFPDVQKIMSFPMATGDTVWLNLVADEGMTLRTIAHVPMLVGQKVIGTLSCYSGPGVVELDKGQIRRIELMARFLGSAVENAKLYLQVERLNARLREQAAHDPLTGLYNFGHLQEDLDRRIHEYRRCAAGQTRPLSMIILDIDHFKRFNDTHGHLAGNAALVEVGQCLSHLARRMDVVCRYGGEEFVVVLPNCDLDGAAHFAERIRLAIAGTPMNLGEGSATMTVSLGVAEYGPPESPAEWMKRADEALYRAKAQGRNRVELAAPAAGPRGPRWIGSRAGEAAV